MKFTEIAKSHWLHGKLLMPAFMITFIIFIIMCSISAIIFVLGSIVEHREYIVSSWKCIEFGFWTNMVASGILFFIGTVLFIASPSNSNSRFWMFFVISQFIFIAAYLFIVPAYSANNLTSMQKIAHIFMMIEIFLLVVIPSTILFGKYGIEAFMSYFFLVILFKLFERFFIYGTPFPLEL